MKIQYVKSAPAAGNPEAVRNQNTFLTRLCQSHLAGWPLRDLVLTSSLSTGRALLWARFFLGVCSAPFPLDRAAFMGQVDLGATRAKSC